MSSELILKNIIEPTESTVLAYVCGPHVVTRYCTVDGPHVCSLVFARCVNGHPAHSINDRSAMPALRQAKSLLQCVAVRPLFTPWNTRWIVSNPRLTCATSIAFHLYDLSDHPVCVAFIPCGTSACEVGTWFKLTLCIWRWTCPCHLYHDVSVGIVGYLYARSEGTPYVRPPTTVRESLQGDKR